MKYFKMVSGKGRVPMTENEISELFKEVQNPIDEQPTKLEMLEKKVESLSKTIEALSKTDVFKAVLSITERADDKNGAS